MKFEQSAANQAVQNKISEDFWIKFLKEASYCQLYSFNTMAASTIDDAVKYNECRLKLSDVALKKLNSITKGDKKSEFTFLGATLAILHSYYTGNADIVFNTSNLAVSSTATDSISKLFFRISIEQDEPARAILQKVKENLKAAFENSSYDYNLFYKRYRNIKNGDSRALSQLCLIVNGFNEKVDNDENEIIFIFQPDGNCKIRFQSERFDERLIRQYGGHFIRVLEYLLFENKKVSDLVLPDELEKELLLHQFNNTFHPVTNATVIDLFDEISSRFPDRVAVQTTNGQLTFSELASRANQVAFYLQEVIKVEREQIVAILLDRNEWVPVAMLGIMKAGCAYLPVDPMYPSGRIDFMLADSKCEVVLTEGELKKICSTVNQLNNNINCSSQNALAYIIYTSGSTGNPKGALIEHKGLLNHVNWFNRHFSITETDSSLLVTSYSFDGSLSYIWACLTTGATLHILTADRIIDPEYVLRYIRMQSITFLKLVPSFFAMLLSPGLFGEERLMRSVRFIMLGGESINTSDVRKYLSYYPQTIFANHYGPTEATIGATVQMIDAANIEAFSRLAVIGLPFDNCSIYILDKQHRPVPVGVTGEICIGGHGVARGYLNRPELTAQKFITSPVSPDHSIYCTGDLGCRTCDGTIIFKGREDAQVKVKGYRIELREIETVLEQHPAIGKAVVITQTTTADSAILELVAFLCAHTDIEIARLKNYLKERLPDFMLPQIYIQVASIPVTLNGKIDRNNLAFLQGKELREATQFVEPRNEMELALVSTVEDVLKRKPVGLKDNFFSLGGDSIKAILLVSRIKQKGYVLYVKDIMRFPVMEELAARLTKNHISYTEIDSIGNTPLGPVQQAFLEGSRSHKNAFNQSIMLFTQPGINEEAIKQALSEIWLHHDALRMTYRRDATGWQQICRPVGEQSFGWIKVDLAQTTNWQEQVKAHHRMLQQKLDLEEGALLQVALFDCPDGSRLLLTIHHMVVDGVSWRILLEDLNTLYNQFIEGRPLQLPAKTAPFKWWQEKLQVYARSKTLQKEAVYWNLLESSNVPVFRVDMHGENKYEVVQSQALHLTEANTAKLVTQCHIPYRTGINDVLIAALALAVKDVLHTDIFYIMMEGHGREHIDEFVDVNRTVGWFTSKYPVLIDIKGNLSALESLIQVKEILHRVPGRGIGYGILRHLCDDERRNGLKYKLQPAVTFNYLGDAGAENNSGSDNNLFSFSNNLLDSITDKSGERETTLFVSGMIFKSRLQLSVQYSTKQYYSQTIADLTSRMHCHLENIIELLANTTTGMATPCDLSYDRLSMASLNKLNEVHDVEDVYRLTPLQEGLFFLWSLDKTSYLQQLSFRVEGEPDLQLLEDCYNGLRKKYPILRTVLTDIEDDQVLQVIRKYQPVNINVLDMSHEHLSAEEVPAFQEKYKVEQRMAGIDLLKDNLFALTVIKYGEKLYGLIWRWHHIICDGWSTSILFSEFTKAYSKATGIDEMITPAPYADYARWLETIDKQKSIDFWRSYLVDYITPAALPVSAVNNNEQYLFQEAYVRINELPEIKAICVQLGITENIFFVGVWGILLSLYNNNRDVVFGTVVSGRPPQLPGIEQMVGLFINTIPVRVKFDEQTSIGDLLKSIQENAIDSEPHHYMQLAEIQSCSSLNKELLNHLLVFENYPEHENFMRNATEQHRQNKLTIQCVDNFHQNQTNYNFNIIITLRPDCVQVAFTFNARIFAQEAIDRIMNDYYAMTKSIIASPGEPVIQVRLRHFLENDFTGLSLSEKDIQEAF